MPLPNAPKSDGRAAVAAQDTRVNAQRDSSLLEGIVFDIKRFSIHDGPGIRTTIFLKGCPLDCLWCHNPEGIASILEILYRENLCIRCNTCMDTCLQGAITPSEDGRPITSPDRCILCGDCVEACPTGAREITGREVTVAGMLAEIEKDIIFYDESGGGVTFSGGEPLRQPDFLFALLKACKEREIHTAVDTSGFASPQILDRIREYTDLFLYDLKLMDDEKHRRFTGVSNALILENLRRLSSRGSSIIVRVPIIPGINDDDENVTKIGEFVAALPRLPQVDILPYHATGTEKYRRLGKEYALSDTQSPSIETILGIARRLQEFGLQVTVGGQDHAHE